MNSNSKKGISLVFVLIIGLAAGILIGTQWIASGGSDESGGAGASASKEKEVLYWVALMDANYRRDKPGKSPMGMDLVPVYASDSETDDETIVHINPGVEQNLGVRIQAAQIRSLFRRVEATGFIGFDESIHR